MQAILDLAAEHNLNEKEATLDKMMEMGQYVHMDVREAFVYVFNDSYIHVPRSIIMRASH